MIFDISKLLAPVRFEEFTEVYWDRKPLVVSRNDAQYYSDLLNIDDVDEIITSRDMKISEFRLVKDGSQIPQQRYSKSGANSGNAFVEAVADVDKLLHEYRSGATIILEALHKRWHPLGYLCNLIESTMGHPVQTNIYLTPKDSQGFSPHYDTHDVFVLQCAGSKHWRIYDSAWQDSYVMPPQKVFSETPGNILFEFTLYPGDLIYIPRGYVHEATTTKDISLHVTLGILTYTWLDIFQEILTGIRNDLRFHKSLPPGFSRNDIPTLLSEFQSLVNQIGLDERLTSALESLSNGFLESRKPYYKGVLATVYEFENITHSTVVRKKSGIVFDLIPNGETIDLHLYGKIIKFPHYVQRSLQAIVDREQCAVQAIEGNIDLAGQLTLARILLREGFIEIVVQAKT